LADSHGLTGALPVCAHKMSGEAGALQWRHQMAEWAYQGCGKRDWSIHTGCTGPHSD